MPVAGQHSDSDAARFAESLQGVSSSPAAHWQRNGLGAAQRWKPASPVLTVSSPAQMVSKDNTRARADVYKCARAHTLGRAPLSCCLALLVPAACQGQEAVVPPSTCKYGHSSCPLGMRRAAAWWRHEEEAEKDQEDGRPWSGP